MESQLKTLRTGDGANVKRKAITLSYLATLLKLLKMPRVITAKNDSDISALGSRLGIKGEGIAEVLVKKFYTQT